MKTKLCVFIWTALLLGSGNVVRGEPTVYFDETEYLTDLGALGVVTIFEGFENNDAWGLLRSTVVYGSFVAPDVPSQGVTWNGSGSGLHDVTTSNGAANSGEWGFYSSPHGNILAGIHDGITAASAQPMVAWGGWVRGTFGADIILVIDGDEINFIDLGEICEVDEFGEEFNCIDRSLQNSPFIGIIDPAGFNHVEVRETEAGGDEAQFLWFDDFTIGFASAPSPRTPGSEWINAVGGAYETGSNWDTSVTPTALDNAIFGLDSAGYTVNFGQDWQADQMVVTSDIVAFDLGGFTYDLTQINVARESIIVGEIPGDNAQLSIANGSLSGVNAVVAHSSGVTANMTVESGGALALGSSIRVGSGGTGTLNVLDDATLTCSVATIGQLSGDGTFNIQGPNASVTATTLISVGQSGLGLMNASGGASLTSRALDVGVFTDGDVVLDGANTALIMTPTGSTDGTLSVGTGDQVGGFFSSGAIYHHGSMTVSNGASLVSELAYIGETRTAFGELTITGAGSSWTNVNDNTFIGNEGDGTLKILAGATVQTSQAFIGRFGIRNVLRGVANVDGVGSTWDVTSLYIGFNNNTTCGSGPSLFSSEGELNVTNGAQVSGTLLSVGERWQSRGTVNITGSGALVSVQNVRLGWVNSSFTCSSSADVNVGPGGMLAALNGVVVYYGTLKLEGGTITAPTVAVHGESLTGPNVAATLSGDGQINADVNNVGGYVSPGDPTGIINIDGNLTQSVDGTLSIDLGGLVAGTQFDRIDLTGSATLGGTLDVQLVNGYEPSVGDSFEIITANSIVGAFDVESLPPLSGGSSFDVDYTDPAKVKLHVVGDSLVGDMNCDGAIDANDAQVLVDVLLGTDLVACHVTAADVDLSGAPDGNDVQPFVELLLAP